MHRNFTRENRDPVAVHGQSDTDRWEKAMSYKTRMNGGGESSDGTVQAGWNVCHKQPGRMERIGSRHRCTM